MTATVESEVFSYRIVNGEPVYVADAPPPPRWFSKRLAVCREGLHQVHLGYACPCGRMQPK